jgi:phosphomannomutase
MRPSGTEPLLRTYAETDTQENTRKFLDIAFKLVEQKK